MTRAERVSRHEIQRLLGISEEFLVALERERIVEVDPQGLHDRRDLHRIRVAWNLNQDLGVNLAGLEVALHLLERIEQERRQFREVLGWLQQRVGG